MESLVDLLPLLFIGLYYLLAGRRRAKLRQAQRERAEAPQDELVSDDPAPRPTPFRSFLDQIEEAMAEAAGEPSPRADEPRPADPPAPVSAPVSRGPSLADAASSAPAIEAAGAEFAPVSGSFDSPAPVDHAAHGFGRGNPQSEESFERAPAFGEPRAARPGTYDPHGLRPPPTTRASRSAAGWQRRLADPQAAQDAFVLQTVFGPRGGRHAERRR